MSLFRPLSIAVSLGAILLAGCHITSNKNGKNDNVDIGTPFGSMQVKTNDNVDGSKVGLTPYPGAVVAKSDGDNDAADVNMSFGSFHLGVKALSYQTGDGKDKVIAFYRKDLARYGDVIECQGNSPLGSPARTSQGLTCDTEEQNHIGMHSHNRSDNELELRAGSPTHQHIVGIESRDGGTHIGLVMLDLPSETHDHDGKQSE